MDDLIRLVNEGRWREARDGLMQWKETHSMDDVSVILEASICAGEGDVEGMLSAVELGLKLNYQNYELYLMLGDYYREINPNQAYLCYENAEFFCDREEDLTYILECREKLCQEARIEVTPTSVVIVSYNCRDMMVECIKSIRTNNKQNSYEIVVVDNDSKDGIVEWLEQQEDIKLILNDKNRGFGYASNQGVKAACPENNILLLNNDTIVPPNALFWLRMGLYERAGIGAAGSVSNYVGNEQRVTEKFDTVEKWMTYAKKHNVYQPHPYENKIWLSGFAMLIKRAALDNVGLFDTGYGLGNYEDSDLGVRLQYAGYQMVLCHNSFIFHYGSQSFIAGSKAYEDIKRDNRRYFIQKWGFDIDYYTYSENEIIDYMEEKHNAPITVLELGCGAGATLNKIQYLYPNARVYGVELNQKIVDLGKNALNILQGEVETFVPIYEKESFDYIIMSDILEHLYYPEKVIEKFKPYLKKGGCFLASIPNIMHASVLVPLLKGRLEYKESGILDKTHIRFFTAESVIVLFKNADLAIERLQYMEGETGVFESEEKMIEEIGRLMGEHRHLLKAYQFIVKARKVR